MKTLLVVLSFVLIAADAHAQYDFDDAPDEVKKRRDEVVAADGYIPTFWTPAVGDGPETEYNLYSLNVTRIEWVEGYRDAWSVWRRSDWIPFTATTNGDRISYVITREEVDCADYRQRIVQMTLYEGECPCRQQEARRTVGRHRSRHEG